VHSKGHLFDSGLINQILDVIEGQDCHFEIEECTVKRTINGVATKSTLMLRIFGDNDENLDHVLKRVTLLLDLIDSAEASMQHFDNRVKTKTERVSVLNGRERNILLLGAGKVASSFAEYLGRDKTNTITVASQYEADAMKTAHFATRGRAVTCDLSEPGDKLKYLIEEADIVVSLLPATMHPMVAEECISLKTDLVTASYESDEMKELAIRCKEAGIAILNEVGLDPG
jgi:alpha-aminoadipic semialdehyde synthase